MDTAQHGIFSRLIEELRTQPQTEDTCGAERAIRRFTKRSMHGLDTVQHELSWLLFAQCTRREDIVTILRLAAHLFFPDLTEEILDFAWSKDMDKRFETQVRPGEWQPTRLIATTDFVRVRCKQTGQYRTRITLSKRRLLCPGYDQRLPISAVLHELIHAYFFSFRGAEAKLEPNGGHTYGFHALAEMMEIWMRVWAKQTPIFRLRDTEASLSIFQAQPGYGWHHSEQTWTRSLLDGERLGCTSRTSEQIDYHVDGMKLAVLRASGYSQRTVSHPRDYVAAGHSPGQLDIMPLELLAARS